MSGVIIEKIFGTFENKNVTEYTLQNATGMEVSIINYGAIITKIICADKYNILGNVVIGFDNMQGYLQNPGQYFGCIAGRYCNRIANGTFSLDGKKITLAKNNNGNSLHGGNRGFDKVWWNAEKQNDNKSLKLSYHSSDGEEGYPGNLNVEVKYTLTKDNELIINYTAVANKPTPVNLTNHSYFNLSAQNNTDILNHEVQLFANEFTRVNDELIPTGEIASVKNTALDFTKTKKIGKDISATNGGYDDNLIINKQNGDPENILKAATVYDSYSGRFMEMFTTEPAVQFYSGNFLNNSDDKNNNFINHAAFCLEAQHYPDSPNHPSFPNTILRPGETYRQTTIYQFSTR